MPTKNGINQIFGIQEIKEQQMPLLKAFIAELIGLSLLVFFGCGSAVAAARGLEDNIFALDSEFIIHVSLTFGLTIASTAQAIGHISGGHINPAVTFGLMLTGRTTIFRGIIYMFAQFLGGFFGAALLKITVPDQNGANYWPENHLGANSLAPGVTVLQGLIVEAMVTFILVLVVFGCIDAGRDDIKGSIPLAIGLTVTLSNLVSIGYTGAGLNPARTLGPALMTGKLDHLWIYFIGPFIGAAVAAGFYVFLFQVDDKQKVAAEDYDDDTADNDTDREDSVDVASKISKYLNIPDDRSTCTV